MSGLGAGSTQWKFTYTFPNSQIAFRNLSCTSQTSRTGFAILLLFTDILFLWIPSSLCEKRFCLLLILSGLNDTRAIPLVWPEVLFKSVCLLPVTCRLLRV